MLTPKAAANLNAHLQRRAATQLKLCENLGEAATAAKSMKQHWGEGGRRSGSTLIALGVALIAFPEPIVSNALATALLAAELLTKKRKKIGVKDVYEEMRRTTKRIKEAAEYRFSSLSVNA